jgi:hypothetical protein
MTMINKAVYLLVFTLLSGSCRKFLDVGDPTDKVSANFVYGANSSAAAVLTGIYFDLQRQGEGFAHGRTSISLFAGLSADEFNVLPLSVYSGFYANADYYDFWSTIYRLIYRINAAIEGIDPSTKLSLDIKQQLLGEAKFLRAFCYFYLVNMYGDVPLLLTTDYKHNASARRSPEKQVYKQIIEDLISAEKSLKEEYVDADAMNSVLERTRPNKWCASALLARVYLYTGDWGEAEHQATLVINNNTLYDTTALKDVFKITSREAIWQLEPVSDQGQLNTLEAEIYYLANGKPDEYLNPIWLSYTLESAFEENDMRKKVWVETTSATGTEYHFFAKYKRYTIGEDADENLMVLRLAEQYLIRAEARAQQGKIEASRSDINIIRRRARLDDVDVSSKEQLLNSIFRERQVEFFCEWGHRWFDLKRTGKLNTVMEHEAPLKQGVWMPYKKFYPIPLDDLKYNINLVQNYGYPAS